MHGKVTVVSFKFCDAKLLRFLPDIGPVQVAAFLKHIHIGVQERAQAGSFVCVMLGLSRQKYLLMAAVTSNH